MTEIIAAVISAVLGALLTWLITRSKAVYIECKELFRYRMSLFLPEAEITFRNSQLKELYTARLNFRNTSTHVIDNVHVHIKVEESTQLLGTSLSNSSDREITSTSGPVIQDNKITLSFNHVFPYFLNQEEIYLDIYSSNRINILSVNGTGILKDGIGWAVIFRKERTIKTRLFYGYLNIGGLIILISTIAYLWWKSYVTPLFVLNTVNSLIWLYDPLAWVIAFLIFLWLVLGIINLWKGGYSRVPIPLTGRRFILRIVRRD